MLNKAQIIGHLGQDPDTRHTPSGLVVTRLSVATNENRKNQSGEKQRLTEWHRVVLFGKTAEIADAYLAKGDLVYLEGRLKTRKWQAQDGIDRYTTEIIADQMRMLGGRNGQNHGAASQHPGRHQEPADRPDWDPAGAPADFEDDIPF
jgi:single-strand DNA-binding protein